MSPRAANIKEMDVIRPTGDAVNLQYGVITLASVINTDSVAISGQAGSFTMTATVTIGNVQLTGVSAPGNVRVGMYITGTGIPAGTYVVSVNVGGSTVNMNNAGVAPGGAQTLSFWGTITQWSGLRRTTAFPVGIVQNATLIDNQIANLPSQHAGPFYFNPPNPNLYPIPTAWIHIGAGTTAAGTAPLKLTTQASGLSAVEQGTFELIGNSLQFTQLAKRRGLAMGQDVMIADFQLVSSASESAAIIAAQHGANYLEVGKCEEIILRGVVQKDVGTPTNTLTIRVKYAGTTIQTIVTSSSAIAAGTPIEIRVTTTCRSTGVNGTMQINSILWIDGVTNVPDSSNLVTIDTTTAQDTTITAQFTNSSATNNLVITQGRVLCIETSK